MPVRPLCHFDEALEVLVSPSRFSNICPPSFFPDSTHPGDRPRAISVLSLFRLLRVDLDAALLQDVVILAFGFDFVEEGRGRLGFFFGWKSTRANPAVSAVSGD